ncbi:3-keto-disaccharide hydrolase [Wenyingzhuangia sp. IMCC45574]
MKRYLACILTSTVFLFMGCSTSPKVKVEKWVNLLEGEQAKNWVVKITKHPVGDNYKNTFQIKDGLLSVQYDKDYNFNKTFGHIFYNKELSHYKLKLDYRFVGEQVKGGLGWAERNSGIMIHCESPYNMTQDQLFPMSIEVQLLGGIDKKESRPTANVCTPGTNVMIDGKYETSHCVKSTSSTYYGDEWVQVEIEVHGNDLILHRINGEEVLQYTKPEIGGTMLENKDYWEPKVGTLLEKGFFSLQSESHPVEFRNIYLLEL